MTRFYDSASPQHIPSGSYAAYYVNGYAWPESEIKRMHRVFGISVRAGEPGWSKVARCLDIERGAAGWGDAVPFLRERHKLGHRDGTIYASLSTLESGLVQEIKAANVYFRLWIADWTGNPNNRPSVDGVEAWAVQYAGNVAGGAYDLSTLFGHDDFRRP